MGMAGPALGLSVARPPLEFHPFKVINNLLVLVCHNQNVLVPHRLARFEPLGGGGGGGDAAQVDFRGGVDLIEFKPIELLDGDGELGGEAGEEAVEGGEEVALELMGDEVLGHRAD